MCAILGSLTPRDRRSFSMEIEPQSPMENRSLLHATSVPAKVDSIVEGIVEKVGRGALSRFREGKSPLPSSLQSGMEEGFKDSVEALLNIDEESNDEQAVDASPETDEAEVEISDIMLRTAEHDIGMAVQKFKNMKDTMAAQIQARRGKMVLNESSEPPPPFSTSQSRFSFQSSRGRGRYGQRNQGRGFLSSGWRGSRPNTTLAPKVTEGMGLPVPSDFPPIKGSNAPQVSEEMPAPKSWVSLLTTANPRGAQLKYVPKEHSDSVLEIARELTDENEWDRCLVGYFLDANQPFGLATQKPQTIRTEWIKVGKGKNVVGDSQGEAPEEDLPSSSNMPICTTTPLEAEGTGCLEGIGESQDGLVSVRVESPYGEDQTVADQDVNTQEVQLKGCSPQAPSPADLTVAHTEPSKGIILPRSPLTRSQSMNKMDPIIMEGQGTQEDSLTPAAIRASSPPIPPGRSSSSKKKNKRST
ncbi:hypothetical protein U1Q18_037840 [Sarracenia purpurea var. burkii]